MECGECGAVLPGEETCLERFHALLAAEQDSQEQLEELLVRINSAESLQQLRLED